MTNQNEPNFIRPGMTGNANPEHTSAQRQSHQPGVGEAFQQPAHHQEASMRQEGRSFARQDEILDSPLDEPARHSQVDMQHSPDPTQAQFSQPADQTRAQFEPGRDPAQARFEPQADPTLAQGREQIISQYQQDAQSRSPQGRSPQSDAFTRRDPDWQNKP